MTDQERTDELAAALHLLGIGCRMADPDTEHPEDAAAILAALPPDWCGHEAQIARLRWSIINAINKAWYGVSEKSVDARDVLAILRAALAQPEGRR